MSPEQVKLLPVVPASYVGTSSASQHASLLIQLFASAPAKAANAWGSALMWETRSKLLAPSLGSATHLPPFLPHPSSISGSGIKKKKLSKDFLKTN